MFSNLKAWKVQDLDIQMLQRARPGDGEGPPIRATPFSGGERNRMFLQRDGNFKDVTLISGADFREDGRGFALLDIDNDGFLDMAIASPNEPRLRILKNRLNKVSAMKGNRSLQIRLVGGQTGSEPSSIWSSREPYGAVVKATVGNTTSAFQLSCGEGISTQNNGRIHIGLGEVESIDQLDIRWPSGKRSSLEKVAAGRITIFENPEKQAQTSK